MDMKRHTASKIVLLGLVGLFAAASFLTFLPHTHPGGHPEIHTGQCLLCRWHLDSRSDIPASVSASIPAFSAFFEIPFYEAPETEPSFHAHTGRSPPHTA